MVDENIIPVDWNESNMGVIAKNINSLVYYDCVKEEKEIVDNVGETFGKLWWYRDWETDRKSTRLNSSHSAKSRMPSSA